MTPNAHQYLSKVYIFKKGYTVKVLNEKSRIFYFNSKEHF